MTVILTYTKGDGSQEQVVYPKDAETVRISGPIIWFPDDPNRWVTIDLTPLSACSNLRALWISHIESIDLNGLDSLERIDVDGVFQIDLESLQNPTRLKTMYLSGSLKEIDLRPFSSFNNLECLDITGYQLQTLDISPLHFCHNLVSLKIYGNFPDIDLTPLSTLNNLERLHFESKELQRVDLSPLASCDNLSYLNISGKLQQIDLNPLSSSKSLLTLRIYGMFQQIDLSPLIGCTNLESLSLQSELFDTDFQPLSHLVKLEHLNISSKAKRIDLSPLSSCKLLGTLELDIANVEEIDLSPLSECSNFQYLSFRNSKLAELDLSPLASCRLRNFSTYELSSNRLDITPVILNPSLESIEISSFNTTITSWVNDPFPNRNLRERGKLERKREWVLTLVPPLSENSWGLLHKIAGIPHKMSISVQSFILEKLGFDYFGLIDQDITDFLLSIPPDSSIDRAKAVIEPFLIERVCEQIDRNGTTIGLDFDALKHHPEIAVRINRILALRREELEQAVLRKVGNAYLGDSLALTAYGFQVIKNLNSVEIGPGDPFGYSGVQIPWFNEQTVHEIRNALDNLGFDIQVVEEVIGPNPYEHKYEIFQPKGMPSKMRNYVLDLFSRNQSS